MDINYVGKLRYETYNVKVSSAPQNFMDCEFRRDYGMHTEKRRTLQQFDGHDWNDVPEVEKE